METKHFYGTCAFCGGNFLVDGEGKLHAHLPQIDSEAKQQLYKFCKRWYHYNQFPLCPGDTSPCTQVDKIGLTETRSEIREFLRLGEFLGYRVAPGNTLHRELEHWEHSLANTIQTWQPKPLMSEEMYRLREILQHFRCLNVLSEEDEVPGLYWENEEELAAHIFALSQIEAKENQQ